MFEMLVGLAVMMGTPAYLVLQLAVPMAARKDHWRALAFLPLLISVPVAVWCFYTLAQDSNLWPLPFILFAPLGAIYLVIVLAAHRLMARPV